MRMSRIRTQLASLLIVTAFIWAGCDRSTAAPERTGDAINTSTLAFSGLSNTEQDRLKAVEESEKQRVDREKQSSRAVYDSLKAVWEVSRDQESSLLVCEPLQYAADVKIIGPGGGNLSIGPHQLTIPKGALKSYQVVTGEVPVSVHVSVKLSPSGLQFVKPSMLRLRYGHCQQPEGYRHRMVYINDLGDILEWTRSYDETKLDDVYGTINHFSKYAVASN